MKVSNPGESHRGYMLLDLIIVMSMIVLILSTTSIWLYKTMRYSSEVKQRDSHARTISRIGHQIRSDARSARTVSASDTTLSIKVDDKQSVEYKIIGNAVHRKQIGGLKVHHDDFDFADNARLTWTDDKAGTVTLDIRRGRDEPDAGNDSGPSNARLDAQIRVRRGREDSK